MIIQNLQKLMETGEQLYAKVCTVHRVNREAKCCDLIPVDGTAELFDVSFQADSQGGGLCFYPAVNSNVLVVFINKHHACICNVSELDLMKLVIDQVEFSVDKDGFLLKKKDETLKKLMTELLDAIQAMVFTTSQGPTTLLQNASTFKTIQTRFNILLKD